MMSLNKVQNYAMLMVVFLQQGLDEMFNTNDWEKVFENGCKNTWQELN